MTEDWSCLSQQDTDPYAQICKEAVEDDIKFESFKRDPRYTAILEHVPYEHGREYVDSIQQYEIDKDLIESFKENDKIGGANIIEYDKPFGMISPFSSLNLSSVSTLTKSPVARSYCFW